MRNDKRRANDQRLQSRAEKLEIRNSIHTNPDPATIHIRAKKSRDMLKVCSCPMCCNPRRKKSRSHEKETLQEKQNRLKMQDD